MQPSEAPPPPSVPRPCPAPPRSRRAGLPSQARLGLVVLGVFAALSAARAQPLQLPGAAGSSPVGTPVAPPAVAPPAPGAPAPGDAARRATLPQVKAIADDALLGQPLMHQGRNGRLVMERLRPGQPAFGLRFSAEGFQTTNVLEPCGVSFGDQPVALESLGRPAGLPRYRLQSSVCPIVFDVMANALLVIEPQAPCVIEAAQCRVSPRGLWGPDARGLGAGARDIERDRARAEGQVRDGFRLLSERAPNDDKRAIAREQAGFSSEREQICRDFQREDIHGFCALKITEARAASLRARLGGDTKPEPRPRRQPAASQAAPSQPVPAPAAQPRPPQGAGQPMRLPQPQP